MEKATLYDYARMCMAHDVCDNCALGREQSSDIKCGEYLALEPDKANEIILKWCEEHPVKTRQDKFLEMFPNIKLDNCGTSILCPQWFDKDFKCNLQTLCCDECCRDYWLAEVEE